jgi:MinD-like ATPase involved in chromosome partitioning or flagellar assembly
VNRNKVARGSHTDEAPPTRPRRLTIIDRKPPAGEPGSRLDAQPDPGSAAEPGQARERQPHARGPLLAVCGLCGGAGASTIAYLIARFSARRRSGAVLLCDTAGPTGGLADHAGVATALSLLEVAQHVTSGLSLGCVYAIAADGVRVLATGPRLTPRCDHDGVELVLEHARAAHALTVVDCGTLTREPDRVALANASHIAWVLPATPGGVRRGARVLDAIDHHRLARELVVARRDTREPKAALRDLKSVAERRNATLILVPHLPGLHDGATDAALDAAQVALQAIDGVLER